jgi:putative phosphoribosyl transferase
VQFVDRRDAGRRLATRLAHLAGERPVVVGLPRGGVPVAFEVARALGAPLDVLVVRKLGCPWQPELGVGALGEGDIRLLNRRLMREIGVSETDLSEVVEREQRELEARVARYRGEREPVPVEGRTVIVVDDGLATGFTARAAIEVLRHRGAGRVVLAVPVAPMDAVVDLRGVADEVVCVHTPASFWAIGQFYDDFTQTADDEVTHLLAHDAGPAALSPDRGGRPTAPTPPTTPPAARARSRGTTRTARRSPGRWVT